MPRAKTYKQKEYEIQQYYRQKKSDLWYSVTKKHDEKAVKEYNRRVKILERNEKNKLHNLKIKMWEAHPNAKKRKKKINMRPYSDACKIVQLIAKLRDTDANGVGTCICCPWTKSERSITSGGHRIPKSASTYTALMLDNINLQNNICNWKGGNVPNQTPQVIAKIGKARADELRKLSKEAKRWWSVYAIEVIKEHLPMLRKLLDEKTFDVSKYYTDLARYESKRLNKH